MASRFSAWLRRHASASLLSLPNPRVRPTLAASMWRCRRPDGRRSAAPRRATAARSGWCGRRRRVFRGTEPRPACIRVTASP